MMNLSSQLRPPRHRRLGRRGLRAAREDAAGNPGDDLYRGAEPMNEITCKLLVIGAGPGGYVCAHPRRPARHRHHHRRGRGARRHLPQCRLHPVQGADPCRRGIREGVRMAAGKTPARHLGAEARSSTFGKTVAWKDGIVERLTSGVAGAAEEGQGQDRPWLGAVSRRQDRRGRDRDRRADDPRRDHRHRHRLGSGRTALPAVRRQRDLLDRARWR